MTSRSRHDSSITSMTSRSRNDSSITSMTSRSRHDSNASGKKCEDGSKSSSTTTGGSHNVSSTLQRQRDNTASLSCNEQQKLALVEDTLD